MLRKWLNGHVTHVVTTALGLVLAAAATGTWTMAWELQSWQERMEGQHDQYEQRLDSQALTDERLRQRLRWLERNREAWLTIWDMP